MSPILAHFRYLLLGGLFWLAIATALGGAFGPPGRSAFTAGEKAEIMAFARLAVERAVKGGGHAGAGGGPGPTGSLGEGSRLRAPGPVFLTLVLDGQTRACQGSLEPAAPTLAAEIDAAARRLAVGDRRHPGLSPSELERGRLVISIPGPRRPLPPGGADPRRFGLVVETDGGGSGVLLPGEARTSDWMMRETRRRAGAVAATGWRAWIFPTEVFGETSLPGMEPRAEERRGQ